jgi:adenylate cyclase
MDTYRKNEQDSQRGTTLPLFAMARWALRRHVAPWLPERIPIAVKLALWLSLMTTAGMALLGAVIVQHQTELLNRNMLTFGHTVIEQLAQSAKEPILANDGLQLDILAANLTNSDNVLGAVLYSADRQVLSRAGSSPFQLNAPYAGHRRPFLDGSLQTLGWRWAGSPHGSLNAISFFSPVRFRGTTVGYAEISFSRSLMTQAIRDSVRSIVIATLVLIVLGIVASYYLGRLLSRPLYDLMDASRAIGNGQYDVKMKERRNDEIGYLMSAFNSMAQGMLRKEQVEDAFAKYVPARVAKNILSDLDQVELAGKQAFASVMFVDIVGFTAKSETLAPEGVAELLNEFYAAAGQAAALYHGTIDKYMGDCVMLVFGIPEADPDHVFNSIACAVFFQKLIGAINDRRLSQGKFPVHYRIGLNSGDMLAGVMGTADRVQYTVVGDSVNLASRLCAAATADQVVITEQTYNHPTLRKRILAAEYQSIRIRGKSQPVTTYLVHDVHAGYRADMERHIRQALDRIGIK